MKYTLAYQHNNGAYIYESADGTKVYNYNKQWFSSMTDVNKYIIDTGIKLKRTDHNLKPRVEDREVTDTMIKFYKNYLQK